MGSAKCKFSMLNIFKTETTHPGVTSSMLYNYELSQHNYKQVYCTYM